MYLGTGIVASIIVILLCVMFKVERHVHAGLELGLEGSLSRGSSLGMEGSRFRSC